MTTFTFTLEQLLMAPPAVRLWAGQQISQALDDLMQRDVASQGPAGVAQTSFIQPVHAATDIPLRQGAMQQGLLAAAAPPAAGGAAGNGPTANGPVPDGSGAKGSAANGPLTGNPAQRMLTESIADCSLEEAVQILNHLGDQVQPAQLFFELGREPADDHRMPPLVSFSIAAIMQHVPLLGEDRLLDCLNTINQAFQRIRGNEAASLFGIDGAGFLYVHPGTHRSINRLWRELLASGAAGVAQPPYGPGRANG